MGFPGLFIHDEAYLIHCHTIVCSFTRLYCDLSQIRRFVYHLIIFLLSPNSQPWWLSDELRKVVHFNRLLRCFALIDTTSKDQSISMNNANEKKSLRHPYNSKGTRLSLVWTMCRIDGQCGHFIKEIKSVLGIVAIISVAIFSGYKASTSLVTKRADGVVCCVFNTHCVMFFHLMLQFNLTSVIVYKKGTTRWLPIHNL